MKTREVEGVRIPQVSVLGCPIDLITMDDVVRYCRSNIQGRRRPSLLLTVNAFVLVMMNRDERLRRVAHEASLVLPDGAPVAWIARGLGRGMGRRVTGIDLMDRLLEVAGEERWRIFFLGATEEVVRTLADGASKPHPGIVVAGYRDGFFREEQRADVVRMLRESRADILFIGMPSPFKETFAHDYLAELDIPVVLPVGGAFDVLVGLIPRAPRWVQVCGMEWFWRLALEPRRLWRRYLITNSIFFGLAIRAMARRTIDSIRRSRCWNRAFPPNP